MTSEGCSGIIWSKDERRIMESNTGGRCLDATSDKAEWIRIL